jgi:hypothetical protein
MSPPPGAFIVKWSTAFGVQVIVAVGEFTGVCVIVTVKVADCISVGVPVNVSMVSVEVVVIESVAVPATEGAVSEGVHEKVDVADGGVQVAVAVDEKNAVQVGVEVDKAGPAGTTCF